MNAGNKKLHSRLVAVLSQRLLLLQKDKELEQTVNCLGVSTKVKAQDDSRAGRHQGRAGYGSLSFPTLAAAATRRLGRGHSFPPISTGRCAGPLSLRPLLRRQEGGGTRSSAL